MPAGLSIEGIGANTGETIFAGTSGARLFAVDSATGTWVELNIAAPLPKDPGRLQVRSPTVVDRSLGFALLFDAGGSANLPYILQTARGDILRSRGLLKWEQLPNVPTEDGPIYAIAVDRQQFPPALFAASDGMVWVSYDDGDSWGRANQGLPKRPHSSDLRIVDNVGDGRWLYLATYGRSVWRCRLD